MVINYEKILQGEYAKCRRLCRNTSEGIISQGGDVISVMVMLVCLDKLYGLDWESIICDGDISLELVKERQQFGSKNCNN